MLHEYILVSIGIIGFGYAGYLDLRHTEFPDWIPYSMIAAALAVWGAASLFFSDPSIIYGSVSVGIMFLGFGLLLYFSRQWGDGDAWLLGAFGFLYPNSLGIGSGMQRLFPFSLGSIDFPLSALFNFFILGFLYLVAYSFFLGIRNRRHAAEFFRNLKGQRRIIYPGAALLAAYTPFAISPGLLPAQLAMLPYFIAFLLVFASYGKFVEKRLFRKRVHVKKLRAGDVLVRDKWRGLTEKEVKELQKKGGNVWIKEGVRFAPVFILTEIVTLFYGSLASLFV